MATLADLAVSLCVPIPDAWSGVEITGISDDSRRVQAGEVFVAVPGALHDGADYAEDALRRGATVVVSERSCTQAVPNLVVADARVALALLAAEFHGHATRSLFTVGVTGTNGKTTVCHLTAHLLGEDETAVIGTVANEARGLRAATTPGSLVVQAIARDAVLAGRRNLVIEASSIGLAQHRLDAVDFDVAAFTNLSRDHHDFHGGREAYLEAKLVLFRGLKESATAVVNADDPAAGEMLGAANAHALTYSSERAADLSASDVRLEARASSFRAIWQGRRADVRLPLPGRHNVENALAAIGIGLSAGLSLAEAAEGLRSAAPVPGRCEFFQRGDGVTAVVDFAHTPDALARVLDLLRHTHSRILVVFGCPGDSDRGKREQMGEIAGRHADLTVVTLDNPKHEDPDAIINAIASGVVRSGGRMKRVLDRAEAIRLAVADAHATDVVLVAGKGHETYQIVGDRYVEYSDAAVLQALGFTPLRDDLE
ncbi:UDP-N-acetylmuramoyl-L-alanyl-D-glutamate--2,6-diaminopimelate ligase [Candidatus Bipolaricaulota bacterium]|nr:UDP-N-acetylmuramoyl-L-alanyl-D-glutamate--2,6-diaminopimelate ligase [Candidatus Bipolaricaulota bacterium]